MDSIAYLAEKAPLLKIFFKVQLFHRERVYGVHQPKLVQIGLIWFKGD
jgi:hypothetical protein